MQWYAVQVTTGHEKKVKRILEKKKADGFGDKIGEILLPERGEKVLLPGYIFFQSSVWPGSYVRIPGTFFRVLGVVSDSELPRCQPEEVREKTEVCDFAEGDLVVVTAGPFAGRIGLVKEISGKKSKLILREGVILDADNKNLERVEGDI